MKMKMKNEVPADPQAKLDPLPLGTGLVPSTGDSDVADVEFTAAKADNLPVRQVYTKEQILELLNDGAPSWASDKRYGFLADRDDLCNYKDIVLVAARDITELLGFPELEAAHSHFGESGNKRPEALVVWRKRDWRIARELVAKMWNLRDEGSIHFFYDCPFGCDEGRHELEALAIEEMEGED
jgi:hypothetical protein